MDPGGTGDRARDAEIGAAYRAEFARIAREKMKNGELPYREERPHRCNDRLEDFIKALVNSPTEMGQPWRAFWNCLWTDEGKEKTKV
ncbi:Uncharacterized protein PBTT_07044 [Plasmodiophora brassicae]|uniref:Uncharacterized protein n=1 Tax=Plasmodiophora brassicae TaxID=37360 RepID=A0A0G4J860_PLABS|nr:hypothetical protein PBRA_003352 [Plasmodiophora brassicae]SPQ99704.1 unnamed protein product [Plasmodiophora brassicae]